MNDGTGEPMKELTWRLQVLVISIAVTVQAAAAGGQDLEFFLPASQSSPHGSTKVLQLPSGERFEVAKTPIASVSSQEVVGVSGVVVPAVVMDAAGRPAGRSQLYRVKLGLSRAAQNRVQEAMDQYCRSGADVHIARSDVVIDHVALLGCGRYEVQLTFPKRADAETFAEEFAGTRIRFLEPTEEPTPSGKVTTGG